MTSAADRIAGIRRWRLARRHRYRTLEDCFGAIWFERSKTPAWGLNGGGDGQFNYPWDVAVDNSGNVYVADYGNHRIQKFNSSSFSLDDAVPDDGDIIGDLNSRRGRIQGMEGGHVDSQVPMAEMLNYSPSLKSITGGRGSYHMEFSHYDEVPSAVREKIIAEAKAAQTKGS